MKRRCARQGCPRHDFDRPTDSLCCFHRQWLLDLQLMQNINDAWEALLEGMK
jgi:hypothetical protein